MDTDIDSDVSSLEYVIQNTELENILLDKVFEIGIVKIIIEMKNRMEILDTDSKIKKIVEYVLKLKKKETKRNRTCDC